MCSIGKICILGNSKEFFMGFSKQPSQQTKGDLAWLFWQGILFIKLALSNIILDVSLFSVLYNIWHAVCSWHRDSHCWWLLYCLVVRKRVLTFCKIFLGVFSPLLEHKEARRTKQANMILPGFRYMINRSTRTKIQKICADFQDLEMYIITGRKKNPNQFSFLHFLNRR